VLPFPPLFILLFVVGVLKLGDNDGPVPELVGLLYVPLGLFGITTLGIVTLLGLVP
jgi:hypothetical protein